MTIWHNVRNPHRLIAAFRRRVLGTITHVSTCVPVVALTFDDGPHPESTPRLLDILEKHQAHATFFMVGESAKRHQWLVKRIAQQGHAIGNHSWDHTSFPLLKGQKRRAQIRACSQAINPYGQRIFRPPYGDQTMGSRLDALLLGHQVITWSLVANDWLDHDADWISDKILNMIKPGDVILFHDTLFTVIEERYADRKPVFESITMILERLANLFQFVTIPELLRYGRPQRQLWYKKTDPDWLNKLIKLK